MKPKRNLTRNKFISEYSVPGEYQWVDVGGIQQILDADEDKATHKAREEVKVWVHHIKASFAKIQSTTPESVCSMFT